MEAAAATPSYAGLKPGRELAPEPAISAGPVRAAITDARTAPQRLAGQWAELARFASEPTAFSESWFMAASLRHLELPAGLKTIEVWRGSTLLGLLMVHPDKGYARLPVPHVINWLHFHSFLGTPVVRAGAERDFWKAVLQLLDGQPWAKSFLHLTGLVENGSVHRGLIDAARELGRPCDTVHRSERALLESDLSAQAYYERTVRKKKRKELKRLSGRLSELGAVELRTLGSADELQPWSDAFLELERSGWKGERGSALACDPGTAAFFREALEGAFHAGKLHFLRLDLDGRPLAMLVNFLTPPGSFSFKIAIDEEYARFSPGVLIQIENLKILERSDIGWMDSCAAEDHPMINSLWGERRKLVRVTVPLAAGVDRAAFNLCRLAERGSAAVRGLRNRNSDKKVDDDE